MSTISNVYTTFVSKCNHAYTLLSNSALFFQEGVQHDGITYTKEMNEAIVEYSFMKIYLAWEEFLENAFILYLSNEPDLQGNLYARYGLPLDNKHAYDMIKGVKSYPDWTSLDDIIYLSKVYFENQGAFAILSGNPVEFADMKIIRNRISHTSKNSVNAFNRLLAKTNTQSNNISVSDFLLKIKQGNETYFTYYTEFLKGCVEAICSK